MFTWFKKTRQTHSKTGYWVHLIGQWLAVIMMFYFWRAMLHLLDTAEAFAGAWQNSSSEHYGFVEGLVAIPVHLISEPFHFLQLASIIIVLHLTVNRAGYRSPIHMPHTFNSGGLGTLAVMSVFRR
ncbi:hypothetical protein LCGC14_0381260 [marine sediment metagenome]|uniref:Uncharacterized protein n=1 Tax=marine sediment metagenome TaxID=412755 RepID=A0A0F9TKI7_9ZZZZ